MRINLKESILALSIAVFATACVDAPTESLATDAPANQLLSVSFDMMADEQLMANDVERSEDFRWAALALRVGLTPSVIQVTNDGRAEVFDAFVHAATWTSLTQALRPPLHRSLVAWRRSGDVLQVVLVGLVADSAPVLNPLSLRPSVPGATSVSPVAGAKAAYFERGPVNSTWIGVGGTAKVAEQPQPTSCPVPNDASTQPKGVTCQQTKFGIALNVLFGRTPTRDSREVLASAPTRRIIVSPQAVAGVKLVFSCASPLSSGCN